MRSSGVQELWVTEIDFWRQLNLDRRLIDSMAEKLVKQVVVVLYGWYDDGFTDNGVDAACSVMQERQ